MLVSCCLLNRFLLPNKTTLTKCQKYAQLVQVFVIYAQIICTGSKTQDLVCMMSLWSKVLKYSTQICTKWMIFVECQFCKFLQPIFSFPQEQRKDFDFIWLLYWLIP